MHAPDLFPQLERCSATQSLQQHELAHLLSILVGVERATRLVKAIVSVLEEGLEESWYEKQMRRRYGLA